MAIAAHLVAEAIALGYIDEADADRYLHDEPNPPPPRSPDPWRDLEPAERLEHAIRAAASGAPAFAAVRRVVTGPTGRAIPPPPTRRTSP